MTEHASPAADKAPRTRWLRILTGLIATALLLLIAGVMLLGYALIVARPNLPPLDAVMDYRPKIPLRIYTADNFLIGEFGEERRNLVRIQDIPKIMRQAVLAIEDDRFYEHGGVDYIGVMRAGLANLRGHLSQGASTITMQVARNFFLSSEKTYTRKIYEVLLAYKIEANLSKDQILELYMNQIYLGQRAYGFASAAQIYFGKDLKDITVAEAAMLAGLPKAPSAYNPIVNPQRARIRQRYILQRMRDLRYITPEAYEQALNEELQIRGTGNEFSTRADYVAEMARQLMYAQYKEEVYTRGLTVYTTITKADQDAAYDALRRGVMDYDRRHGYRGPEAFIELPGDPEQRQQAIDDALVEHPHSDTLKSAVVVSASPRKVDAVMLSGELVTLNGDALRFGAAALAPSAQPKIRIRPGAVIRVTRDSKSGWLLAQLPEVSAAFISLSPEDGSIRSMVGGFDFNRTKFNSVTQAWRQPGSSFKPFIYSASLEKGFSPGTVINDAPLSFSGLDTGGQAWEPKNYDGRYEGPMTMRRALSKSKNLVSIRVIRAIGTQFSQDFVTRFGFEPERHPPYLTMALGAGSVTPMQLAAGYAVFANGGYRVEPYLISKVVDQRGQILAEARPQKAGNESIRVIDPRNAYIMDSMLRDVVRSGTAASARQRLGRNDMAGKTGTTNDSIDAWFAGYTPQLVGVAWMGYDNPRSLGQRETGGGLALPIWINYMSRALKGVPERERTQPEGLIQSSGGDLMYEEYANAGAVRSLGLSDPLPSSGNSDNSETANPAPPAADPERERQRIMDLFRN